MLDWLRSAGRFLLGTNRWIQRRPWLAGGTHHGLLTALAMTVALIVAAVLEESAAASFWAGGPLVVLYLWQWLNRRTRDNALDFAVPAAFFALWWAAGAWPAWAALTLYGLLALLYYETEPSSRR